MLVDCVLIQCRLSAGTFIHGNRLGLAHDVIQCLFTPTADNQYTSVGCSNAQQWDPYLIFQIMFFKFQFLVHEMYRNLFFFFFFFCFVTSHDIRHVNCVVTVINGAYRIITRSLSLYPGFYLLSGHTTELAYAARVIVHTNMTYSD